MKKLALAACVAAGLSVSVPAMAEPFLCKPYTINKFGEEPKPFTGKNLRINATARSLTTNQDFFTFVREGKNNLGDYFEYAGQGGDMARLTFLPGGKGTVLMVALGRERTVMTMNCYLTK